MLLAVLNQDSYNQKMYLNLHYTKIKLRNYLKKLLLQNCEHIIAYTLNNNNILTGRKDYKKHYLILYLSNFLFLSSNYFDKV